MFQASKPTRTLFFASVALLSVCGSSFGAEPKEAVGVIGIVGSGEVASGCEPDLMVPFFMPPVIRNAAGLTVYVSDATVNVGGSPAPASVTRYYLSNVYPVDPSNARIIGERQVKSLAPNEMSGASAKPFTMPADLPFGTYYLAACLDAADQVDESNEGNNCTSGGAGGGLVSVISVPTVPSECVKVGGPHADLVTFAFDGFEPGINRFIGEADAHQKIVGRFGKPQRVESAAQQDQPAPGMATEIRTWQYDGLSIVTSGSTGYPQRWIRQITLTSPEYPLQFGLSIGSSRDAFVEKLGQPKRRSWYTVTDPIEYSATYQGIEVHEKEREIVVHSTVHIKIFFDKDSRANKIVWKYSDEHWRYAAQ